MEKTYSVQLTEAEIRLASYCIYAEFGQDGADWTVDNVNCRQLRKKLKEKLCEEK